MHFALRPFDRPGPSGSHRSKVRPRALLQRHQALADDAQPWTLATPILSANAEQGVKAAEPAPSNPGFVQIRLIACRELAELDADARVERALMFMTCGYSASAGHVIIEAVRNIACRRLAGAKNHYAGALEQ